MSYDFDEYDDKGMNVLYPLSGFFILGIYLVINRYHSIRNRAVPFTITTPLVSVCNIYTSPSTSHTPQQITDAWDHIEKIEEPGLDAHVRQPNLLPPFRLDGRTYITCYDPSTSYHLATLVADNGEEIQHKIAAAVTAQHEWSETTFQQRRRVMRSLNKWLVDNQDLCAKVSARDTGKTRV